LNKVDFPEHIKTMQKNWIGRSEGYEVNFRVLNSNVELTVFTTRLDTLFGVTYLVLAPEHPMVKEITTREQEARVEKYVEQALNKTDFERQAGAKEKTGVATGAFAVNPATREKIPV
jgi:leucyl-tRNA synthetase